MIEKKVKWLCTRRLFRIRGLAGKVVFWAYISRQRDLIYFFDGYIRTVTINYFRLVNKNPTISSQFNMPLRLSITID